MLIADNLINIKEGTVVGQSPCSFAACLQREWLLRFVKLKALTVGAGRHGRIRFVRAHSDGFKCTVVLILVVVFAACHVANNAVVCVTVISHFFHLGISFWQKER